MQLFVFSLLEFLVAKSTKRSSYHWFFEWLLWKWNSLFKNRSIDFSSFMKGMLEVFTIKILLQWIAKECKAQTMPRPPEGSPQAMISWALWRPRRALKRSWRVWWGGVYKEHHWWWERWIVTNARTWQEWVGWLRGVFSWAGGGGGGSPCGDFSLSWNWAGMVLHSLDSTDSLAAVVVGIFSQHFSLARAISWIGP